MEFNEDGSLKIPKEILEARELLKEKISKAKDNSNKVIVKYIQESEYEDNWLIELPINISKDILFKLKKWADAQHKVIGGSTWIDQQDNNEFILVVKGHENKCTWAHSFLNGLNTALIKEHQTKIEQIGTCKHSFYVRDVLDVL